MFCRSQIDGFVIKPLHKSQFIVLSHNLGRGTGKGREKGGGRREGGEGRKGGGEGGRKKRKRRRGKSKEKRRGIKRRGR